MNRVIGCVFFFLLQAGLVAEQVDIVAFSYDRPLQLYAFLESLCHYTQGIQDVFIIYRCSNSAFAEGYEAVRSAFSDVKFIEQESPFNDFQEIFFQTVYERGGSDYVLFAVDDIIVTDKIDLRVCIESMEAHNAYGFYLRLGCNIIDVDSADVISQIPPMHQKGEQIYLWQLKDGRGDWAYPHTLDMTVYRKKDLNFYLKQISFTNPNELEGHMDQSPSEFYGLCYETSKMVNIPLNIVSETSGTKQMNVGPQNLLDKFNEGLKIDISQFHQVDNKSTHVYIYSPGFIPRN